MIPSRHALTADFLSKTQVELFDVSAAGNNVKTMKKVKYQNHVRKLFLENQQTKLKLQAHKKKAKDCEKIKLIHADWACKVSDIRLKFLPDFETLKKPGFGHISKLICC